MAELPITCTLGAADFRKQTALIRDLSRGALLASRRGPLPMCRPLNRTPLLRQHNHGAG
jgi:hypothetical protein